MQRIRRDVPTARWCGLSQPSRTKGKDVARPAGSGEASEWRTVEGIDGGGAKLRDRGSDELGWAVIAQYRRHSRHKRRERQVTESAVGIDLGAGVARLVRRAIVLMHVMPEMRCLRRFLLMLTIAGRNRKGGVQREQHGKNEGKVGTHYRGVYQDSSHRDSTALHRFQLHWIECFQSICEISPEHPKHPKHHTIVAILKYALFGSISKS